jgi:hypothetical protein
VRLAGAEGLPLITGAAASASWRHRNSLALLGRPPPGLRVGHHLLRVALAAIEGARPDDAHKRTRAPLRTMSLGIAAKLACGITLKR